MDINKSGDYMATAGRDAHIRIYDPNRRKVNCITLIYAMPDF